MDLRKTQSAEWFFVVSPYLLRVRRFTAVPDIASATGRAYFKRTTSHAFDWNPSGRSEKH